MKHLMYLPPGWKIEHMYRYCPRCGFDLTQQVKNSGGDQSQPNYVEYDPAEAGAPWVAGDFETDTHALLQRMVAPFTEAEKEHAQRNEQRWLDRQRVQESGAGEQKHSEAAGHQHLVPMVKRKFVEWAGHVMQFIRRRP